MSPHYSIRLLGLIGPGSPFFAAMVSGSVLFSPRRKQPWQENPLMIYYSSRNDVLNVI